MDQSVERPDAAFPDLPDTERKALTAINRFIEREPPENSRVFWISPRMAEYLLAKYNDGNRPMKPAKIGEYRAAMEKKEWRLTGDTIKFSNKSLLRDGQNRLSACVASGESFQTHIVFGIPDEFFNVMDQGKNRDGSDLLAIAGVPSATTAAGAVRWAHLYGTDTVPLRTTFRPPEILRLYNDQYQGVSQWVNVARQVYNMHKWPATFVAGTLYHLATIDPKAAADFGNAMAKGNFSGKFHPLDKMRIQLAGIAAMASGRVHDTVRAALMIKAWNLVRANKRGTQKDFKFDPTRDQFPKAQ